MTPNKITRNRQSSPAASTRSLAGESLWKRFSGPHQLAYLYAEQQATQEEAAEVTPEHLLRGMLRLSPEQSNGLRIIEELGVSPAQADARLPHVSPAVVWPPQPVAGGAASGALGLSAAAQAVAGESRVSADAMGHERVGTEHLLLGLLALPDTDSAVAQALNPCGVTQAAVRERLGASLVNGTYKREPLAQAAQVAAPAAERFIRTIFSVRRWAQIIYVVWVLGTGFGGYVVPMPYSHWLQVMNAVTVWPLLYFIVPYIISTYTMNYLLRSRFSQGLGAMPPRRSTSGLAAPFTLNLLLGIGMMLGLVPYIGGLLGGHVASVFFGGLPIAVVGLQWVFLLNCVALIVTHWLLVFNVR